MRPAAQNPWTPTSRRYRRPTVPGLGMAAVLAAQISEGKAHPRPTYRPGTIVVYQGALYPTRRGHEATVHQVREREGMPYVLEFRDGWRGIAEARELEVA